MPNKTFFLDQFNKQWYMIPADMRDEWDMYQGCTEGDDPAVLIAKKFGKYKTKNIQNIEFTVVNIYE